MDEKMHVSIYTQHKLVDRGPVVAVVTTDREGVNRLLLKLYLTRDNIVSCRPDHSRVRVNIKRLHGTRLYRLSKVYTTTSVCMVAELSRLVSEQSHDDMHRLVEKSSVVLSKHAEDCLKMQRAVRRPNRKTNRLD